MTWLFPAVRGKTRIWALAEEAVTAKARAARRGTVRPMGVILAGIEGYAVRPGGGKRREAPAGNRGLRRGRKLAQARLLRVLPLDGQHLLQAAYMPLLSGEPCGEERIYQLVGNLFPHHPRRQAEHVHVVVLDALVRGVMV